jgi:hypothetical protein
MSRSVPDSEIDMGELVVHLDARTIRPHIKVLAGSAALVAALAGCGGGSQKPAVLSTPAGATSPASGTSGTSPASSTTTSSSAPTTSAPSTSAPAGGAGEYAAFPGFTPPADLKTTFDPTPSTGDPVKDKILADDVQVQLAFDVWSVTGDFKHPGISTYLGTGIYGIYQAQTVQYHAAGKVPAGTTRYYDRKVTALDSRAATVIDCEDGRQNYDKIAKTGQQVPNSSDGIVAISTTYVKNSAGVYLAQMTSKEKAPAICAAP